MAVNADLAEVRDRGLDATLAKRTEERLSELERVARRDVFRLGFVRYNSFSDVGSDLSYALALLNLEGDGVVLTSIYSREETRTYGKSVRKYVPQNDASKEEQQANAAIHKIERDGAEVFAALKSMGRHQRQKFIEGNEECDRKYGVEGREPAADL